VAYQIAAIPMTLSDLRGRSQTFSNGFFFLTVVQLLTRFRLEQRNAIKKPVLV